MRLLKNYKDKSIVLSDYVLSEVLDYITHKQKFEQYTQTEREAYVSNVFTEIYKSRYVEILKVTELDLGTAISYMTTYPYILASLTDWLSLILMVKNKIRIIQTFDHDFKTIIHQIPQFREIKVWRN